MAINLFLNTFPSAIVQVLVRLYKDPLLEWNYGTMAGSAFSEGGILFWHTHKKQDKGEDRSNVLPDSKFLGREAGGRGEEGFEKDTWHCCCTALTR